jgi:cytochrome c556
MLKLNARIAVAGVLLALGSGVAMAADPDTQKQIDAIRAALPKFAIPMREVGDRFQNMYFAANKGNWALAAYMSKYMNGAMNPAALTKAPEYAVWKGFYENGFVDVNKAIQAKDLAGFNKAYGAVVNDCNNCHAAMGYGFIKVVKQDAPSDQGVDYALKSEPGDVPK